MTRVITLRPTNVTGSPPRRVNRTKPIPDETNDCERVSNIINSVAFAPISIRITIQVRLASSVAGEGRRRSSSFRWQRAEESLGEDESLQAGVTSVVSECSGEIPANERRRPTLLDQSPSSQSILIRSSCPRFFCQNEENKRPLHSQCPLFLFIVITASTTTFTTFLRFALGLLGHVQTIGRWTG